MCRGSAAREVFALRQPLYGGFKGGLRGRAEDRILLYFPDRKVFSRKRDELMNMSETLYLKWRPARFRDVVGQEKVVDVLMNQSAEDRFSHAYLFTGTRGTGKTTCARILAKAINCRHKENGDPCGVCPTCRAIESGDYLDVIEMDAASNNGIDDMRDLKEKAVYNPTEGGKKVYIIDEVHMLSTSAFNGFLKLLEEPPEHVIFILATTDVQKLPATIISRCQRFDFRRIGEEEIAARCLYVAGEEGIDLTPDGAKRVASLSDGAMRNALSALEQLAAAGGRIDADAVSFRLGLAGSEGLLAAAKAVASGDAAKALDVLGALYDRGVSAPNFLSDLSILFRDAAVVKAGAAADLLGAGYKKEDLRPVADGLGYERIVYSMTEIGETLASLRQSPNARVDTELCLIRLAHPAGRTPQALAARLDALEKKLDDLASRGIRTAGTAAPAPKVREEAAPAPAREEQEKPSPVRPAPPDGPLMPVAYRAELLRELRGAIPLLPYTQLQICDILGAEGRLVLSCKSRPQADFLGDRTVLRKIREKAASFAGGDVTVSVRVEGEEEKKEDPFLDLLRFGEENPDVADVR